MERAKELAHSIRQQAVRLYRDEQGAEGLEKLLIIGAIVLPLLAALFFYRREITDMVKGNWNDVESDTGDLPSDDGTFDSAG
ncbi:MAG TPA: hypothetical protein DCM28_05955 [Phycisphaerales bacterium]|nr:hypothetical protein [Phycisphaerales bacterium]HCD34199.1 hypothetical protein [Phycisphaerales bacterium]|tara:strand:+ start:296 stop:541 length:246 start_codon:yes stop_codon:yes gene_type:complete